MRLVKVCKLSRTLTNINKKNLTNISNMEYSIDMFHKSEFFSQEIS